MHEGTTPLLYWEIESWAKCRPSVRLDQKSEFERSRFRNQGKQKAEGRQLELSSESLSECSRQLSSYRLPAVNRLPVPVL